MAWTSARWPPKRRWNPRPTTSLSRTITAPTIGLGSTAPRPPRRQGQHRGHEPLVVRRHGWDYTCKEVKTHRPPRPAAQKKAHGKPSVGFRERLIYAFRYTR